MKSPASQTTPGVPCGRCGRAVAENSPLGLCPRCLMEAAVAPNLGQQVEGVAPGLRQFGEYELLELRGEGGQGKVFRAWHRKLNRTVALKLLRGGALAGETNTARFRAEASAAAALRHPGIVGIYEVGEQDGQPYYTMEYVQGTDLATLAEEEQPAPEWAARCVACVAEAVQAAHEHGVLHRDLKPSNVLLDVGDTPRVTDFGLARRFDDADRLTLSQQALGTPGYAAPELVSGSHQVANPATDVYGTGVILYHLLTGRPPFVGASVSDVLRQVMDKDPIPPRALRPEIPRDLETICLKCLRKEPARRYPTARALAEDLNRFLHGQPIQAQPLTSPERLWRWCRRRPALTAVLAALALCLMTLTVGSTVAAYRINNARLEEQRQHEKADRALGDAYLAQARAQRLSGKLGQQFGTLEAVANAVGLGTLTAERIVELRKEAIAAFALVDLRSRWTRQFTYGEQYARLDAELGRYAVAGTNGLIQVHRIPDDAELFQLVQPVDQLSWRPAQFSTDGHFLSVVSPKLNQTRLWDLTTHQLSLQSPGSSIGFSADSRSLVFGDFATGTMLIQDLVQTNRALTIRSNVVLRAVAVDPEAKRLVATVRAAQSQASQILVFDLASGEQLCSFGMEGESVRCALHPRGHLLAVTSEALAGAIQIYSVPGAELVKVLAGHVHIVPELMFSADGSLLASSSWDNTTRIWSIPAGLELLHINGAGWVTFSPDSRKLGLMGWEQDSLTVFDLAASPTEVHRFQMSEAPQPGGESITFDSTGGACGEDLCWPAWMERPKFVLWTPRKIRHHNALANTPTPPLRR